MWLKRLTLFKFVKQSSRTDNFFFRIVNDFVLRFARQPLEPNYQLGPGQRNSRFSSSQMDSMLRQNPPHLLSTAHGKPFKRHPSVFSKVRGISRESSVNNSLPSVRPPPLEDICALTRQNMPLERKKNKQLIRAHPRSVSHTFRYRRTNRVVQYPRNAASCLDHR